MTIMTIDNHDNVVKMVKMVKMVICQNRFRKWSFAHYNNKNNIFIIIVDDFDFPFSILTNDQNDQNDQNHSTFSMEVSFPKNVNLLRIETIFLLVSGKNFIKFVKVFVNRNGIVVTLQHEK